jgi:hypothetical protein
MGHRILHIHMPRLGLGLPSRTVRPFARTGDGLLEGFLAAIAEPAEELRITGSLFDRDSPPAHLVDRVVAPLADLVRRGTRVTAPAGTPRTLLFLAAGIRSGEDPGPNGAPEFWRAGRYECRVGERVEMRQVEIPRVRRARVDVTGFTAAEAVKRIRQRLLRARGARLVRLTLAGETTEEEILHFGPRELQPLLPAGVPGSLSNEVVSLCPEKEVATDDERRRAALRRVRDSLPELPETTGVYEFRDEGGRPLYVGKAVNLRRRVASHFTAEAREPSPRGPMLLATRSVSFREHPSEVEALLAEADRIREVRPPYNRQMREPEGNRYLRADLDAGVPTLTSARRARRDGALYLGPFPKRWLLERALRVLMVVYGLRSCRWELGEEAPVACTDRDLGICSAPCTGRISTAGYRDRVRLALDHVTGRSGGEPAFGLLNSPAIGLLGRDDLRILAGFRRSAQWLLRCLREANGLLRLSGGRALLVLGGLRAGVRGLRGEGEKGIEAWAARRIESFLARPVRTWVRPDQADEVRILSGALRALEGEGASGDASTSPDGCGMESPP